MTFPAIITDGDSVLVSPEITYSLPIVPVIQCQFCRHWKADADGLFGECVSVFMADMLHAKWEPDSPIMMAAEFEEPKFFESVEIGDKKNE